MCLQRYRHVLSVFYRHRQQREGFRVLFWQKASKWVRCGHDRKTTWHIFGNFNKSIELNWIDPSSHPIPLRTIQLINFIRNVANCNNLNGIKFLRPLGMFFLFSSQRIDEQESRWMHGNWVMFALTLIMDDDDAPDDDDATKRIQFCLFHLTHFSINFEPLWASTELTNT